MKNKYQKLNVKDLKEIKPEHLVMYITKLKYTISELKEKLDTIRHNCSY